MTDAPEHPGPRLRTILDGCHITATFAARALQLNRPHLNNILTGKAPITRQLAYQMDALVSLTYMPEDRDTTFAIARVLIDMQAAFDWHADEPLRQAALSSEDAIRGRISGRPTKYPHEAPTTPD